MGALPSVTRRRWTAVTRHSTQALVGSAQTFHNVGKAAEAAGCKLTSSQMASFHLAHSASVVAIRLMPSFRLLVGQDESSAESLHCSVAASVRGEQVDDLHRRLAAHKLPC